MNNDPHKMKNDVMASIMSNPKLAKTFKEAMAAPIGSTKRAQAKSMLSIMNKVAPTNDGQGGLIGDAWNAVTGLFGSKTPAAPAPAPSTSKPFDFSNLMIFPAAPAFKTPQMSVAPKPVNQSVVPKPAVNMSVAPKPAEPNFFDTAWNDIKGAASYALNNMINVPKVGITPITQFNELKSYMNPPVTPKPVSTLRNVSNTLGASAAPILGTAAAATLGALQYGGQNLVQGGTDVWNAFAGEAELPKIPNLGYTTLGNTVGSKFISNAIAPAYAGQTPAAPVTPGTPVKTDTTQVTPPVTTTGTTTPQGTGTPQSKGNAGVISGLENLAASNVAKVIGVSSSTPLAQLTAQQIANAIPVVEGYTNGISSVAVKNNNPGNLKYAGQSGATQDERGFAVFSSPEAGQQALVNDIQHKMNSGQFTTLNDLMSVYSPNSDNPGYTGGTDFASVAAGAANSGLGATGTALDYADKVFGGDLGTYLTNLDEKLKAEYKLPELEKELSSLKNQGATLIPTLKTYMNGRDQYLKAIDAMISKTEDNLGSMNLADPNAMNSYNRQLTYLYTLKGKQEGRYQNFLNAAIGDYNADLTRVQDTYNSAKTAYTAALTSGGTIAQNQYNNIVAKMTSAITELDPITIATKAANLATLNKQLGISNLGTVENGLNGGIISPEYISNVDKFTKFITVGGTGTDKDALDFAKLPQNGLIGLYSQAALVGGEDPGLMLATTEAIRRTLKATLDSSSGDPVVATKVKKLLTDLASDPRGANYATAISNTITPSTSSSLSSYIKKNISAVETAINDLVKGGSGFLWTGLGARKPGIQDKTGWMASHSSLDKDLLEGLYNLINSNVQAGTAYEKDPSLILKELFPAGKTDQEKADLIAAGVAQV